MSLAPSPIPPADPGAPDDERLDALPADEAAARLAVDPAAGLDPADAARRLADHGPNRLAEAPRRSAGRRFVDQFRSVLILVLAAAAGVAAALGDLGDAAIVGAVLVLNAFLGFLQEGRAENAMAALRSMLVTRARVRRGGHPVEVDAEELVPGDVVVLEAGDRVPADGRFLHAVTLAVDESSLTGESVPVDKTADPLPAATGRPLGERRNRGFLNTTVVRGRAELLVTATGMRTEMGRVAALMQSAPPEATPLQGQLDKLGRRLAVIAGAAVTVVFATRLAQGEAPADALLGSVALAVAAIPEGLPAVVTVTLAVGVHQMALRRAVVKRLASVETLGSTTVICSDKTGTLTLNEMTAREVVTGAGRLSVSGEGYTGGGSVRPAPDAGVRRALTGLVLCNDAALDGDALVGDPTEGALLALATRAGLDVDDVRRRHPRLAEVPFDSAHKYMATFHRDGDELVVVVKGAPDVVLGLATGSAAGLGTEPLSDAVRARWLAENDRLAGHGMRVLAVATRRVPLGAGDDPAAVVGDPEAWMGGLTMQLLVGLLDPPRTEARDAVARCRRAGIAVKMITGDHAATAGAIAAELGIAGRVVTGAELDGLTDDELAAAIDGVGVCARVSPEHKVRVVRALRARGHVVAMTGDGVNDAAALRSADIGVAMGVTGTAVTKEAADMVLTDDNFATIVEAVERGRAIFDNIVKFVRFQLTTNLAAIATLLTASVLGLPAPLTAVQVLFVNLIADGPPAMTLGVDPPAAGTMARPPRAPGAPILDRGRILRLLGPAAVMAVGTLGVLGAGRAVWGEAVGLTMAFTTFVLFQVANVFNARTETASVLSRESLRNSRLWAAAALVVAFQVAIVSVGALQGFFATTALSATQWLLCAAVALTVVIVEEARKAIARAR
jgi:Ca2+-transporting ATPase